MRDQVQHIKSQRIVDTGVKIFPDVWPDLIAKMEH